jgi:hypothetical protein
VEGQPKPAVIDEWTSARREPGQRRLPLIGFIALLVACVAIAVPIAAASSSNRPANGPTKLALAGTYANTFAGPTVFGSALTGHSACISYSGAWLCLTPTRTITTTVARDVVAGTRRVEVRIFYMVSNGGSRAFIPHVTPLNTVAQLAIRGPAGLGGSVATLRESSRGAGSACQARTNAPIVVPSRTRVAVCLVFGATSQVALVAGQSLGAAVYLQFAGIAQWASGTAEQPGGNEGFCEGSYNTDETCPVAFSEGDLTPALGADVHHWGFGCQVPTLYVECGPPSVTRVNGYDTDGTSLGYGKAVAVSAAAVPGCSDRTNPSSTCLLIRPRASNGPIVFRYTFANAEPTPTDVTFLAPFVDAQVHCTSTGCDTYRIGAASVLGGSGTCSWTYPAEVPGGTVSDPGKAVFCLRFDLPAGARVMTLGTLERFRTTAAPRSSHLNGTWYGLSDFSNAPIPYGTF